MKKRPDTASAALFRGTHPFPAVRFVVASSTDNWFLAASAVSETAFSDLVARNAPQVERLMQKKNMQGLIDLSYELDVSPFLEKLQRYNLILKLGINKLSPTEAITLIFKSAFLQSFRLTMPGTVLIFFCLVTPLDTSDGAWV
jgi:hypothetical protein